MKKKRFLALVLTAIMTAASLAGCASKSGNGSTEAGASTTATGQTIGIQTQTEEKTEEAGETFPVTVTDQLGREVTIEKEPQKLVSGYYVSTSIVIALNLEDKLVGVEAKAGKRAIYKLAAEDIVNLPSVGTAKEFDLEGCAALSPDLVIVPAKLKDKIASMEELGLTVIAVNPENNDLLKEAVELIGKATGQTAKADDLVKTVDKGISSLKDRVGSETNPTVYLAGNSNILQTAGAKMYQNTLIENAGGVNVAAEIDDNYWAEVSYEQILKWDPDYIIIAADADYTVDDVLKDTNLADCKAVKNGNVYIVPSDAEALDSPVPAGYLGSYYIASVIHSDVVSEEDFQTEAINFYEKFYEFTPYKN